MNEQQFKQDILLYKNRKFKYKKKFKKVKTSKVESVLMSMKSNLYGYTYFPLSFKIYNKLLKMENIKFSYKFLDGSVTDDEDFNKSDLWVKNVYYYNNGRELFSKLFEIILIEYCLNDNFWIFDSYYCYMFMNFKLSFNYKTKKYKFKSLTDFYKFIFGKDNLLINYLNEGLLTLGKKRYNFINYSELKNRSKLKKFINKYNGNRFLYSMNKSQFVDIESNFLKKIKSISIQSKLYLKEFDESKYYKFNDIKSTYENYDVEALYVLASSPIVVSHLENYENPIISYYIKNKVLEINGKPLNKKKNLTTILKKYLPGTKYGNLY